MMKLMDGECSDGRRPKKPSAGRAHQYSSTLLPKRLDKLNRTKSRCSTEWTIGARSWMELAASIFTATTVWRWGTSTTTDWMTSTSANLQDFRTDCIAIAAMGRLKMRQRKAE